MNSFANARLTSVYHCMGGIVLQASVPGPFCADVTKCQRVSILPDKVLPAVSAATIKMGN